MASTQLVAASLVVRDAILAAKDDIEKLDMAIGDGDHYHNLKRGAEMIAAMGDELLAKSPDAALHAIATRLMSTIGGASGPLIASFFLGMARAPGANGPWDLPAMAGMFAAGVAEIQKRGKAALGDKTMLDVLIPVAAVLSETAKAGLSGAAASAQIKQAAEAGMLSTRMLRAQKGRAAFLGERAIGHIDPGAMSSKIAITAVCDLIAAAG